MPFLRPVPMTKVGLVGLRDDRDVVLSVLHDLGVVQVEPLSKEALEHLEPERGGDLARQVGEQLIRFRGLKAALPPQPPSVPRRFAGLRDILALTSQVPIDETVGRLKREEDALLTERKSLADTIDLLGRFGFYADRLEYLNARHVLAFFGEAEPEAYQELRGALAETTESVFQEGPAGEKVRFLVAVRADRADAVGRLAQQKGVELVAAPRLEGTAAEALPRLQARLAEVDARLGAIAAELERIAVEWYGPVAALEEALSIEGRKVEVLARLGAGRASFAVEGWVPKREVGTLERELATATTGRTHVYELATKEAPPTLMENPPGVRRFEFFIRFYSLPGAGEWDPTWLFAIAFPIFFGFMLGDWGYGLTILAICLWMLAGFPGGNRIPKALRGFLTMIMSPKGMQQLAASLIPGCAIAIGLGLFFGEFFGFPVPWKIPLGYQNWPYDPITNLAKLLVVAGYIGLVMVVLGFALGALNDYFHHHRARAVGRVGGILFAFGVTLVGLGLIHGRYWPPTASPTLLGAYVLLFGGLALLLAGEGAMGFMALIEVVSHILSYTRLVGILLSSVILAFVIDQVAVGLFHAGPVSALFGAVLLVFGQGFVLVLGVFEPGIQGARLIFVEHFSKFFEGNGRPFRPLGSRRLHTAPAYAAPPEGAADARA